MRCRMIIFILLNGLSQTSPIPVVNAHIVKNEVMVEMDGRLVPTTSGIGGQTYRKNPIYSSCF